MTIWRKACLALVGAISIALAAAGPSSAAMSPSAFATALEKRAQGRLLRSAARRFRRRAAMRNHDRESLRRLHYVAAAVPQPIRIRALRPLHPGHGPQCGATKRRTLRRRRASGRASPAAPARAGKPAIIAELEKAQASEPDWYARAFAQTLWSRVLLDQGRTGDALKLLSHAETLIPEGDPDAASAESTIWRAIGLSLMNLNDMEGATRVRAVGVRVCQPGLPAPRLRRDLQSRPRGDKSRRQGLGREAGGRPSSPDRALRSPAPEGVGCEPLHGMAAKLSKRRDEVLDCFSGLDVNLGGLRISRAQAPADARHR